MRITSTKYKVYLELLEGYFNQNKFLESWMDYDKIKNDLISEIKLTKNQAEIFLLVTLKGKMSANQISKSLDISIDDLIYPFIVPQSKYLPAKLCPINFRSFFIKD